MQNLFAQFHLFEISALATAVMCFGLAALIFKYRDSKLHLTWMLHNIAVGGWALCVFLAALSDTPEKAYRFWTISHSFGSWIAIFTFHPTCLFCNYSYPRFMKFAYLFSFFDSMLHLIPRSIYPNTKFLFNSLHYLQFYPPHFFITLSMWFFLAFFSIYLLFKYAAENKTPKGDQARLFGILSILGYTGGCSSFLPMMGINFYPITMFLLPVYAIAQTYAIFKQQFFGLRVALEKGIIYSTLITGISILYLVTVVIIEKCIRDFMGYNSLLVTVGFALAIGMLVVPLRNKIQYYADKWLFKGTPTEIAEENRLLLREVEKTEKFKNVATLASGVVHEVKNPLTTIRTMAEYLPQKMHDPKFVEQFSRLVPQEIDRIDAMIHELLQFARPSPPKLELTNLYELLNSTLGFLSSNFTRHKINVQKDYEDIKDRPFLLDANQIKQVVLNLFLNAIDAMPQGGTLKVGGRVSNPSVVISVADTGCGIAPEDLKHIFEAFFTKKEKGTGLGLAVTKNIIEEHGGKISVKSKVGEGTTFTLELPLANNKI